MGDAKQPNRGQTGYRTGEEQVTNSRQTGDKWVTKHGFSTLVGLQKQCVLLIFELTKASHDKDAIATNISYIAETLKSTVNSMKKTIARLKEKAVLMSVENHVGRGGWAKYKLSENTT